MDLSIVIATVTARKKYLNRLLYNLEEQIITHKLEDRIEILVFEDDTTPTHVKRNELYKRASGKYVVTIDDDDTVLWGYCKSICEVIDNHDVDQICIGHEYNHITKSTPCLMSKDNPFYMISFMGKFKIFYNSPLKKVDTDFELYYGKRPLLRFKGFGFKLLLSKIFCGIFKRQTTRPEKMFRYTIHTTPIKKTITDQTKFNELDIDEDLEWASSIMEKGLIKTEHIINQHLYTVGRRWYVANLNETVEDISNWVEKEIKLDVKWIGLKDSEPKEMVI